MKYRVDPETNAVTDEHGRYLFTAATDEEIADMALVDRGQAELKARAFAGTNINEAFMALALDRMSQLLALGVTKEQMVKFLDLMIEAKRSRPYD